LGCLIKFELGFQIYGQVAVFTRTSVAVVITTVTETVELGEGLSQSLVNQRWGNPCLNGYSLLYVAIDF